MQDFFCFTLTFAGLAQGLMGMPLLAAPLARGRCQTHPPGLRTSCRLESSHVGGPLEPPACCAAMSWPHQCCQPHSQGYVTPMLSLGSRATCCYCCFIGAAYATGPANSLCAAARRSYHKSILDGTAIYHRMEPSLFCYPESCLDACAGQAREK